MKLDLIIEKDVELYPNTTPAFKKYVLMRNDIILKKEVFLDNFCGFIKNVINPYYVFRTFDPNEKYDVEDSALSYYNPFLSDAFFYLCCKPFPFVKHHTGFVVTKHTSLFSLLFPATRKDISEKLRSFIPRHCTVKRDFNGEHSNPNYSITNLYRNDFYAFGKKVGAIEDYTYDDKIQCINIPLNTKDFNTEDLEDVKKIAIKYKDIYFEKSPGYLDGIGGSSLTSDEFLQQFLDHLKDIQEFNLV
jgi:hypothetical protein